MYMWQRSVASLFLTGLALFCAAGAQQSQQPAAPELPAGPLQQKAITACMECHDAGIMVQQRLDRKLWTREVDKMIRWGAVVDPQDHDALIDYFAANYGTDKPAYVAPRNSSAPRPQR